ncbi:hypothetical protein AnigIFM60653_007980 [Aspergillus niger]|nr:hypothetical protein AnigIFM60653_007980 [Aspergillus niger]
MKVSSVLFTVLFSAFAVAAPDGILGTDLGDNLGDKLGDKLHVRSDTDASLPCHGDHAIKCYTTCLISGDPVHCARHCGCE